MKSLPVLRPAHSKSRVKRYCFLLWLERADDVVRDVTFLARMLVLDGLLALAQDLALSEKDQITIRRRGTYEANFLTELLPSFGKAFDRALSDSRLSPVKQFASDYQGVPFFLRGLVNRVFDGVGCLRADACAESVSKIRQVCYYAYKLDLPYSPLKVDAVLKGFVQTEAELVSFAGDGFGSAVSEQWTDVSQNAIAQAANLVVQAVCEELDLKNLTPNHGPGVTSNCKATHKWSQRLAPGCPTLRSDLYWFNTQDGEDRIDRYPVRNHGTYFGADAPTARVILVPKDSRGPRLISAEPVENQFLQQAVKNSLVVHLEKHPLTRGRVNFTDQSVNQRLALETSLNREWATLDLKDASDRVSTALVKRLFRGTALLEFLLEYRSPRTLLPSGERMTLAKYAPMGSALCFPVLATTVWALSVSYLLGMYGSLEDAVSHVYVYGDDLIVPAEYAEGVSRCLELYGLKINRDKSFVGARFAESCGVDAFDGVDVSPLRVRSMFTILCGDESGRSSGLLKLVAHARECDKRGFTKAAEYYYSLAESVLGPLPYVTDSCPYLGRHTLEADWETRFGEWNDRVNGGRKSLTVIRAVPETGRGKDDPWAHMYRTIPMCGSGGIPERSVYDLPKKMVLQKRRVKGSPFALGVYMLPEWAREI